MLNVVALNGRPIFLTFSIIARPLEYAISSAARKKDGKNLNFVSRLCDGLHWTAVRKLQNCMLINSSENIFNHFKLIQK